MSHVNGSNGAEVKQMDAAQQVTTQGESVMSAWTREGITIPVNVCGLPMFPSHEEWNDHIQNMMAGQSSL